MKVKIALIAFFLLLVGLIAQQQRKQAAGFPTQQADEALQKGEYKTAIELYQKAIEKKENPSAARRGLLSAYLETGRYEEVERLADQFMAAAPSDPWPPLLRGEAQRRRGRYAEAEASLKKALELAKAGAGEARIAPEAQMRLGDLYQQRGRAEEAKKQFEQILDELSGKSTPLTAREYIALGRAYWHLEQYHDANEAFRAAIETDPNDVSGYIERGRLFIEKYDNPYAAELFGKALKRNPKSPAALVGLAESQRVQDSAKAEELCQKALAVNPHLEEAQNLIAGIHIEAEEYAEALTELDKVLQWNPNALETRALRAVCYQFLNQPDKFTAETEKVLAVNPHYGRLYQLLAEYSSYRARYAQAAEYSRRAIALTPNLWSSYSALGINLLRLGDEHAGREAIERAFAKDPFDVRAKNTLDLLDTLSQYQEYKTDHFLIKLHQREADVMNEYVRELLERAYGQLAARYRFQPTTPILFEMYPNHGDFAVRTFGLPGISASGACFGKVVVMDSPNAKELKDFNWGSTLWHELTHVFTLQATENRIPRWFSEGLSMFEEQRAHEGWGTSFKKQFIKAQQKKELLKLRELNSGFIRPSRSDQVPVSYHQAGLICAFIDQRYGFDKILGLLEQYRQQTPTEEAFKKVLGVSLDDFDTAFFKYVDGLKLEAAEKASEDPEVLIRTHEAEFDAHIKMAEAQIKKGGPEATRRAMEVLSAALYINPFDQKLHETLGRLYAEQGPPDAAVREFRVVLALNPVDPAKAHYDLASVLMRKGSRQEAKAEVLKALEIAPNYDKAQELLLKLTEQP